MCQYVTKKKEFNAALEKAPLMMDRETGQYYKNICPCDFCTGENCPIEEV